MLDVSISIARAVMSFGLGLLPVWWLVTTLEDEMADEWGLPDLFPTAVSGLVFATGAVSLLAAFCLGELYYAAQFIERGGPMFGIDEAGSWMFEDIQRGAPLTLNVAGAVLAFVLVRAVALKIRLSR